MKNNLFMKTISVATVLSIGFITASPVMAYTKDETVYAKLETNGVGYSTIVSNHIQNTDKSNVIKDMSELLNIKNINGNEEYTADGSILKWNTNGNDIYYQGNTEKKLPIECNIKYELDGKEISSEELAGKNGNIKITLEYKNTDAKEVKINGEYVTMYTPFVIVTGTILDNTKVKNISITNGKAVDNGTKTLIAGITCPGLQESLDIDKSDFEVPSKIEISFEATDFEMSNIISYATPKLIEESDFSNIDKLDELYSKISKLNSSSNQIVQGVQELQAGVNNYVEKSEEFSSAMDQLQDGTKQVNDNYELLDNGINSLNSSASVLKTGANKVNSGVDSVANGLNQLESGVTAGKTQATEALSKSAETLSAGIDQIIAGKDTEIQTIKENVIESANEKLKEGITEAVSTGVSKTVEGTLQAVLADASLALTAEQQTAILTAVKSNLSTTAIENGIEKAIDETTTKQEAGLDQINENSKGVKAGLQTLRNQAGASITAGITSISAGFDSISSGVNTISEGTQTLKSGTNTLYQGTQKLTTGTQTLATSSNKLKTGISTLNTSTETINNANKQLLQGSQTIKSGINTLTDGITKFDNDGIKEIVNLVNGKVKGLQERIKALQKLANEYKTFSGINEDAKEGTVKFILMSDPIRKK